MILTGLSPGRAIRAQACAMAVALGAVASAPAGAQASADSLIETLQTVCASPGFTLQQRLAVLRDWQPADDTATGTLLTVISDGMMAEQRLRDDFDPERDKDLAARYRERLAKRLAQPVDGDRGALRLLLDANDDSLALAIDAIPGRFDTLVCKALFLAPTDDQLRDLALRFSLVPSVQTPDIQIWQLGAQRRSETSSVDHGRSLLLVKDGDQINTATLNFTMTVRTR